MFLQMPVFIALFNILYMTIDLRQAPFMLWINDLSIQDPFYVLPVLMGVVHVRATKNHADNGRPQYGQNDVDFADWPDFFVCDIPRWPRIILGDQ